MRLSSLFFRPIPANIASHSQDLGDGGQEAGADGRQTILIKLTMYSPRYPRLVSTTTNQIEIAFLLITHYYPFVQPQDDTSSVFLLIIHGRRSPIHPSTALLSHVKITKEAALGHPGVCMHSIAVQPFPCIMLSTGAREHKRTSSCPPSIPSLIIRGRLSSCPVRNRATRRRRPGELGVLIPYVSFLPSLPFLRILTVDRRH